MRNVIHEAIAKRIVIANNVGITELRICEFNNTNCSKQTRTIEPIKMNDVMIAESF